MVTLYTSKTCSYCPMVKRYLMMKNAPFTELDVEDPENMKQVIAITGGRTQVPVAVTDKGFSVGYNIPSLSEII